MTEPTPADHYYTPEQVRDLLRLWPYLLDSRPPRDPDLQLPLRRAFGPGGWREEAVCKHADIAAALAHIRRRDWRAEYAIRAYYCVGLSYANITGYLDREGVHVSHDTVRRWVLDGVDLMAVFLGHAVSREPALT